MSPSRWTRLLLWLLVPAAPAQLTHASFPNGQACCLVPDSLGNLYVIGSANGNVSITKLNPSLQIAATFEFGGGALDEPRAAALDPQGNLLIGGQTSSPDFPLLSPLGSQTATGFLTKVNPATGQILFSTRIGGQAESVGYRSGTAINALATDPAGNIYAAGRTTAADFPVSPAAFQKTGPLVSSFGDRPFGFVLKLSPAGDRLLYSTLLGGVARNCDGGSHCIPVFALTSVNALTVDANGIVTVAGNTNATDFPVTPGALQSTCRCREYAGNSFVTQFNATASALRWSTFLSGSAYGFSNYPRGVNVATAIAQDPAGNILVAGLTDATDFPTTPGALQPALAGTQSFDRRNTDGFLSKLNPAGTALLFSTYLGGPGDDRINHLHLDPQSNVWVTGGNSSPGSFFAQVAAAGQAIRVSTHVSVLGPSGALLRLAPAALPAVSVFGIADSFSGPAKARVAPGEFVSIYGAQLGPSNPAGAAFDTQGRIATQLAGTQVLFNGIPAPLLYTSPGQVNALVPYAIGGLATVTVQVNTPNGPAPPATIHVTPAQPAVLRNGGSAAFALNQDGAVNSPSNPTSAGSIVTVFAGGAGLLASSPLDGSLAPREILSLARPLLPVSVLAQGRPVELLYAGYAPGLVVNLLQLNFRVPAGSGGLFQLRVGDQLSDSFTLHF